MAQESNESSIDLPALKVRDESIEVVYDFCVTPIEAASPGLSASEQIFAGLARVESEIRATEDRIDALDRDIDRLTNHADRVDNLVAVGSGLLAGLIDVFWVGEFSFERGKAWSNHTVNDFVMKVAKAQGYEGERLQGAIEFLEKKYPVPSDSIWKGQDVGISAKSHHLDDLAHHPTPAGAPTPVSTRPIGLSIVLIVRARAALTGNGEDRRHEGFRPSSLSFAT